MSLFLASVLVMFSALSCEKEGRVPHNNTEPNPEPDPVVPTVEEWDAEEALGYFRGIGTDDEAGCDIYNLVLTTSGVEVTDNGFAGVGVAVLLDMNTPSNGGDPMRLMPGNYVLFSDQLSVIDYCFYPGSEENNEVTASYLYYRASETVPGVYYPITDGTLSISTSGAGYTIDADFVTSAGTFPINYTGPIDFSDVSSDEDGDGGEDGDDGDEDDTSNYKKVTLTGLNQGYAYYCGQPWDVSVDDYSDWMLYICDKQDIDFYSDSYLQIELFTAKADSTIVPDGTYKCLKAVTDDTVKPFTMVPGLTDADNYCIGTWYFGETDSEYYGPTSGSAVISYKDGEYKIFFQVADSYESVTITADITAKLEYHNDSDGGSSQISSVRPTLPLQMQKYARKMMMPRAVAKRPQAKSTPAFVKQASAARR